MSPRRLGPLLTLLFLSGAASAQIDFVAVNIGPAPDEIYYVDLGNVGAAVSTPPIAILAGNFIRGIELTAEKTGWYVATSALASSPTGFYRLDDGVSTLVAPLPFTATGVGGLAFSPGEDFLYWVVDPPVGEDELWMIDFAGNFTLVAPLNLPGAAVPAINGVAVNSQTGLLYVVETTTDVLYAVDPLTANGTPVGPLGIAAGAVGGLDFSLDGTNRLFYASGSSVYEINPNTGGAGLSLGNLPGGSTSSIAAIPGRLTLKTPPLVIGTTGSVSLSGGNPLDPFTLFYSSTTASFPVPGTGVVRLDLLTLMPLVTGTLDATGAFTLPLAIPNIPGLIGLQIPAQAISVPSTTNVARLTNLSIAVIQ